MRALLASTLAFTLAAADSAPPAVDAAAPAPAPAAADPTAAIIAEGAYTYRQRDLDALLQIALRHARNKAMSADGKTQLVTAADEDRLRQTLIGAFTAREALLAALAGLPDRLSPAARDAIVLDLLAYKAEPAAAPPAAAPAAAVPAAAPPAAGPAIIRLPPFTITCAIDGKGRRQLTIGLALAFADGSQAKAMEAQAPVLQDAVLAALRGLPAAAFTDPDHHALKQLLSDAVRARIPGFPADGLLIPQLDAGSADAAASDK